jgi:hypothetical protein
MIINKISFKLFLITGLFACSGLFAGCISIAKVHELKTAQACREIGFETIDESIFPDEYPKYLKQVYILLKQSEQLRQLNKHDRDVLLIGLEGDSEKYFRGALEDLELNIKLICSFARAKAGQNAFKEFMERFGLDAANEDDIELEVLAQIERMSKRESYYGFVQEFNNANHSLAKRMQVVGASIVPSQIEFALRYCDKDEYESIKDIVIAKDGFGPQTDQDKNMLNKLEENRLTALNEGDEDAALKWRAVVSQLLSQPVGREQNRLPFSKPELFAMMRNAERTLEQRKRPFTEITSVGVLDEDTEHYALEIIEKTGVDIKTAQKQSLIAYSFLNDSMDNKLNELNQIYKDILANKDSGQTKSTIDSIHQKNELIEELSNNGSRRIGSSHLAAVNKLIQKILEREDKPYRLPFIEGIILLKGDDGKLVYRLIEDFPMIVAGATYPYQWKHDNEVNIALLLANTDPFQAAQAVRFIIYHGMWRGEEAKKIGLYGWLPQIIFGNRQTGKLPEFNNKTYHYFPDFRFRPTKKIDAENERNRTSEIMQLPFFGWTVWRVYEELETVNKEHALAFLKEVYPYVRANTEAIRTALDPYDEAVLSGRDAWVNGMDNAWYHLMVMNRHLPERFIPEWAKRQLSKNRVDNRVDKKPGNPVDPQLAEGRPSDYYYAFKLVFYDIVNESGLDPVSIYHASPYNAKDVAITGVMARSLLSQIAMAEVLGNTDTDIHTMSTLSDHNEEVVGSWDEEIDRYKTYLDRMKKEMNEYFWLAEDKMYYNRDVTQMFQSIAEQQFCHITIDKDGKISYEPREEYWDNKTNGVNGGHNVLNKKAMKAVGLDDQICSISLSMDGNIQYKYTNPPQYWKRVEGQDGTGHFQLNIIKGDPFIVEQFCKVIKDKSDNVRYEPDMKYWTWVEVKKGNGHYILNEVARKLIGQGARKIEDSDLLRLPAIAGFFPLFGGIPGEEQAFQLSMKVVNPWMWWPIDGIPIPTQPMMVLDSDGRYVSNKVYDSNKYWLGPAWMASTKPVIDGFNSYGYEMMYLYLVQLTVGTLQDGRAVEHWRPETGAVNTSNINFPWAASCMAGSIWEELTEEEQGEYLQSFHPDRIAEIQKLNSVRFYSEQKDYFPIYGSDRTMTNCSLVMEEMDETVFAEAEVID